MVFAPVKFFHRLVAASVLFAFLSTSNPLPASASAPALDKISPASPFQTLGNLSKLSIPEKLGKVEDFFQGSGNSTVILIQDAHAIPEAQQNIQKLIEYLQKEYGIRQVLAEGASGELDPQILHSFPDKDQLEKTIEGYYQRSEISGVTAAAILSPYPSQYAGVEDWNLYQQGVGLYLAAIQQKPSLELDLARKQDDLKRRKTEIYSPQLLKLDDQIEKFQNKKTELAPFLHFLSSIQKPAKDSLVETLLREMEKEDSGFDARKICRGKACLAPTYIQGTLFFEELESYVAGIKNSLIKTDVQRSLDQETHRLDLMEKLIRLELSRKEWEEIKHKRVILSRRAADGEGSSELGDSSWRMFLDESTQNDSAFSFYQNAEAREQAFLKYLDRSSVIARSDFCDAAICFCRRRLPHSGPCRKIPAAKYFLRRHLTGHAEHPG